MKRTLIVIGNDPETSKKVQKKLFNSGFFWCGYNGPIRRAKSTDSLIISANSDGNLFHLEDWWGPLYGEKDIHVDKVYTARYFLDNVDADKINGATPAKVKELSMDELNFLTLVKFGYKVKIVKKA